MREPLARAVAIYYWLGRRPASLRKVVGIKEAVTNPLQPPPVVKATHYAKNLPEAYTGPGASDLPRWPWHSFAWGASEAVEMLEARQMAVVVLEHYDESLLALRRLMKWPVAEVLYTVKRRAEGLSHASWESWPPGAIRALKVGGCDIRNTRMEYASSAYFVSCEKVGRGRKNGHNIHFKNALPIP